jgi:magnesium chelatase family protein
MHIEIPPVPHKLILKSQENSTHGDTSAIIKERVIQAQQIQLQRNGCLNAQMNNQQIKQFCEIDDQTQNLLESAIHKFGLSARAFHKILKVSRTIADIEASKNIAIKHASEAISYRKLDRKISI